jgi:hypothetical protein
MIERPEHATTLADLLKTSGFSGETRFYRHTLAEHLEVINESGAYRISANPDPSEAIVDI